MDEIKMDSKGLLVDVDLQLLRGGGPRGAAIPELPTALSQDNGEEFFQESLSRHSEFLHLPIMAHHGVWLRWVLTKYALPNGNVTDFAYLATTSALNTIVLMEIEDPYKPMWVGTPTKPAKSSQFTRALEQVEKWRADLREPGHLLQLISDFKAMMGASRLTTNSWEVRYVLVYGRSQENNTDPRKRLYADLMANSGITLLTYDNMVTAAANGLTEKKNIVRMSKPGPSFSYAYLNREPESEFAFLNHGSLVIDNDISELLESKGYNIADWKNGEPLALNGKDTLRNIRWPAG